MSLAIFNSFAFLVTTWTEKSSRKPNKKDVSPSRIFLPLQKQSLTVNVGQTVLNVASVTWERVSNLPTQPLGMHAFETNMATRLSKHPILTILRDCKQTMWQLLKDGRWYRFDSNLFCFGLLDNYTLNVRSQGKQLVLFSRECWCFPRWSREKHQDSRENKTNSFPEGPSIKCFVTYLDFHFNSDKRITGANQNSRRGT